VNIYNNKKGAQDKREKIQLGIRIEEISALRRAFNYNMMNSSHVV